MSLEGTDQQSPKVFAAMYRHPSSSASASSVTPAPTRVSVGPAASFFPKVDAHAYWNEDAQAGLPRSAAVAGGPEHIDLPIRAYDEDAFEANYGGGAESCQLVSPEPLQPDTFSEPYLYPMLTRNERLRLTMLWYHTRDMNQNTELMQRLQEKVDLVKEFLGWDFAICGLVDSNDFTRVVTAGIPVAVLPRRESTCSHTVVQKPGVCSGYL